MKATRSAMSALLKLAAKVPGMMPGEKPLAMYLLGSVIESEMNLLSGSPESFWLAEILSRLGPTVPVAPAAVKVWQPLQPAVPVKIVLPAAALPPEPPVEALLEPPELGGGALELAEDGLAVVIGRVPSPTELALLVVVPEATMTITITATPAAVPIRA